MPSSPADPFNTYIDYVFSHEKGYVDDPLDPGGATNLGITHETLGRWRGLKKKWRTLPKSEVENLTKEEAAEIYRAKYWDSCRCSDLPRGLDYAVFDYAINSGPSQAAKDLQREVGAVADGIVGGMTLKAVNEALNSRDVTQIIEKLLMRRLRLMRRAKHRVTGASLWERYGRGWSRRVEDVKRLAIYYSKIS